MLGKKLKFEWITSLILVLLITLAVALEVSEVYISTIAGGGACDGGLATIACLSSPGAPIKGPDGSIFIADSSNHRVRKLFSNGTITTIAGTGVAGYNGDGIPAISAKLNTPQGLALNSLGELFISDNGNNRIRKILTNGTIITFAGTGVASISGDNGLAVNASINYPYGLALNSKEELLFCDVNNNRIRKVMSNGTIITVAGSGSRGYNGDNKLATSSYLYLPLGVSVDSKENLYIADTYNNRIRKVLTNGTIITITGLGTSGYSGDGGPATSANINSPIGIEVSPSGDVYFSDSTRIRVILTNGTIVTAAGTGTYGFADGYANTAFLADTDLMNFGLNSSDLYFSDKGNHRIRLLSNGNVTTVAGVGFASYCGENIEALSSSIGKPEGAAIDSLGNIYIAGMFLCFNNSNIPQKDSTNHRVRKISHLDGTITTIAGTGTYGYNGDGILATNAQLNKPSSIAFDSKGNIYIADSYNNRVRKILTNGTILTVAGTGSSSYNRDDIVATDAKLNCPGSITLDSNGILYIADSCNHRIRRVLANGNITTFIGSGSSGFNGDYLLPNNTKLNYPQNMVFDSSGNLIFADMNNHRIRKMFTNGTIVTIAGTGNAGYNGDGMLATLTQLKFPQGVAIDNNEIIIADSSNHRIRRILSNGTLITITGTGVSGYSDDGTVASSAKVNNPSGVVVKRNGEIIIVDTENNRLRLLSTLRTCNGTLASDPNVCNGIGVCSNQDVCDCGDLYGGQYCEFVKCFGIISNSSNICSSRGVCISPNNCVCNSSYFGDDCEISTCFGIASNDSSVCSGNGNCSSIDTCQCENGWTGTDCSILTCFNIAFSDSVRVCSGHGNCSSVDTCDCQSGWEGLNCSVITRSDPTINITNSTTTSNTTFTNANSSLDTNGTSFENITLFSNYSYPNNETNSTNNTWNSNSSNIDNSTLTLNTSTIINSTNISNSSILNNTLNNSTNTNPTTNENTTTNSNNTTYTSITCFGIDSNNSMVCNSKGKCNSTDVCICYSNSNDGYFTSQTCSTCQEDYFGNSCLTKFIGPLRLSNETNGVDIKITSPYFYNSLNVPCSDLLHSEDLKLFGNSPKCYWKEKASNSFFIEFGNNFNLNIGDSIRFNTFVFESSQSTNYIQFNVESPLNAIKPIAIISTRQVSYSTCENVIIDASNSYSLDRKSLLFNWTIIQSPNSILNPASSNSSKLVISESSLAGDYIVTLQVESSFTKLKSEPVQFKFTKSNTAVPILTIDSYSNQLNVKTMNIPITIEKKVSFASCYSNISTSAVKVEWKQTSGNQINFNVNSNYDLVITNFPIKGTNKYIFNVTATFESKSVSTEVIVQTNSENLFSNLYIESITTEKALFIIESQDFEQSSETESWTIVCKEGSQNSCGNSIDSKLSNLALLKQSSFQLNSNEFTSIIDKTFTITLTINKGQRIISSSIQLQYPKETTKLPPLISLLNVSPNRKKLTLNEILNLQLSITKSDATDLINIQRNWTLNGNVIPSSNLQKMSSSISTSNSIILSLTNLVEGSNNELKLIVTDLDTQLSASYSYSFTIAKVPPYCPCIVSPSTGYALETDFTFSCSNCQNLENSLTFSLSFIDDKSGTDIPLVLNGGNTFTTKLPYPVNNPLYFNIEIVDSDTGASVKNTQQISILLPVAASVKEVKTKVSKWNSFQNSLQQNDLRRMIFNSAIISRTSAAMISALSTKRSTCLNGGQYNSERKKCICTSGFGKKDCSLTIEDFTILKEFKKELFNNFYSAFENNQQISEIYLIYQLYGLDSLLSNYDEVDSDMFLKSIQILMNLVNQANDNNLRVSSGVDNLFSNILNSIYNYLVYNGCENCLKETILQFSSLFKSMSQTLLKSKYIGESDLKLNVQFISLLTNRNYRNYYKNMKTTFNSNYNILSNLQPSKISNRQLLTFISTMTLNYLGELPSKLISKNSQISQNGNITTSLFRSDSIVSNLISFEFITDVSLNETLTFSFADNENMGKRFQTDNRIEYSCVLIQNYTNIIMDTDCKLSMNNDYFYCTCDYQRNSNQIAILKSEYIEKIERQLKDDSKNFYYLFFLLLTVLILVVVLIIVIIIVRYRMVAKKAAPIKKEVELPNV